MIIVLDSAGIGALPDAAAYGDSGSDTVGNTSRAVGGLRVPYLASLGLGNLTAIEGVAPPGPGEARGAFGRMATASPGKDTMTGHWEMAGIVLDRPMRTYPRGFPPELVSSFERAIGRGVLGNVAASGTEIIGRLGAEHVGTGRPIVYTSADSVFQVAAHEDVIPVDELYRICRIARGMLVGEHQVGRVIARPFTGAPGGFRRTERRRDFSLEPPGRTLLEAVCASGLEVMAVGKIEDIFSGRGITRSIHTASNDEGVEGVLRFLRDGSPGLIFANLVDFDMLYGHRNDPRGYAAALERADRGLEEVGRAATADDLLFICADHGCDPTTPSTDHSREYAPLLAAGGRVRAGADLGTRATLADLGATAAEALGVRWTGPGAGFLKEVAA